MFLGMFQEIKEWKCVNEKITSAQRHTATGNAKHLHIDNDKPLVEGLLGIFLPTLLRLYKYASTLSFLPYFQKNGSCVLVFPLSKMRYSEDLSTTHIIYLHEVLCLSR